MTEFETMKLERTCRRCGAVHVLFVTATGYAAWDQGRGAYVQTAFPELSADERELLVSGMCGACFDAMFADLDDDEDEDEDGDQPRRAGIPGWLQAKIDRFNRGQAMTEDDTQPTPGRTGAGPTPAQCVERALLGLTAEGEPATRGHLRAPSLDWPRCTYEIPGLQSPIFLTAPGICDRPATLMMGFTREYVASMAEHTCADPDCPIAEVGADPQILEQVQHKHVPVCGMHLPTLRRSEREWIDVVGQHQGIKRVYDLAVIGVESVSLLGGGHPDGAQVIDLRGVTGRPT